VGTRPGGRLIFSRALYLRRLTDVMIGSHGVIRRAFLAAADRHQFPRGVGISPGTPRIFAKPRFASFADVVCELSG
jgi:hypothetical protein